MFILVGVGVVVVCLLIVKGVISLIGLEVVGCRKFGVWKVVVNCGKSEKIRVMVIGVSVVKCVMC